MWNNLTFPWHFAALFPMLRLLKSCILTVEQQQVALRQHNSAMQYTKYAQSKILCFTIQWCQRCELTKNSILWTRYFPDNSLTFAWLSVNSRYLSWYIVIFCDTSRLSRQLVTLYDRTATQFNSNYFMTYCVLPSHHTFIHHTVCSVITTRNLTPVQHDDWNVSQVCLSHARPTQNTPSIAVMK